MEFKQPAEKRFERRLELARNVCQDLAQTLDRKELESDISLDTIKLVKLLQIDVAELLNILADG